ncbi:NAD(P)-binding protein [Eremomyces bilateralis CBS 781.70]|uniref:NAD(P)-binding protein n=1 Tax=Eremomyces bilateralis CBS 781.70 TaxID=1392243 RepID=A0A6G1FRW5_9PEZI|nr:NAD(P)-binding protein [Eremomyces bilateralis CBS 781.70]KAF1808476.1 NAD(P)-binding protein [Eremomyces bilateralis CBS 781.70]
MSLQGKVAIVTGASRGIGAGIALEFAHRGAKVLITYTSETSNRQVDKLISDIASIKNGSEAAKVRADLRQLDAPDQIVSACVAAFGPSIDILVNCAGTEMVKEMVDMTPEDFASVFDLNVRGPYFLSKAVIPRLRKPGRIINISSVGGRLGLAKFTAYCASKGAIEGMTRALAGEIGPAGHTVNAVAPGPVQSDMMDNLPADLIERQKQQTPVENRVGTVDDIALTVAWVAEEQSRWISGQTISASGGLNMY